MIIEANPDQIDELASFPWELQACLETASYPMYKTKKELRRAMLRCLRHDEDKVLACYSAGRLIAAINLMVEQDNKYLQTNGIYAKTDLPFVYRELTAYLAERYRGFVFFSGYPKENEDAIRIMQSMGAECVDSSVTLHLNPRDYTACPTDRLVQALDPARFDAFAAFHDACNADIYWSSARIKEALDKWKIYVIANENRIIGYILYAIWNASEAEIYCASVDEAYRADETFLALLSGTVPDIFLIGKKRILYMVDDNAAMELAAALRVGFREKGHYRCFKIMF